MEWFELADDINQFVWSLKIGELNEDEVEALAVSTRRLTAALNARNEQLHTWHSEYRD